MPKDESPEYRLRVDVDQEESGSYPAFPPASLLGTKTAPDGSRYYLVVLDRPVTCKRYTTDGNWTIQYLLVKAKFQERPPGMDRRTADEIIDLAGDFADLIKHTINVRFVTDIDLVEVDPCDRVRSGLARIFYIERMHECTFGHEALRNRAAYATAATCDDGDTPLVFVHQADPPGRTLSAPLRLDS